MAPILALCLFWSAAAPARAEAPLSAIDWLSNSVQTPPAAALPLPLDEPAVAASVAPEDITVMPLGAVSPDAAGLLPIRVSGLPKDLWGPTSAADLARVVRLVRADLMPGQQQLLERILLAELEPPFDADVRGLLFLARVDKLLDIGALDQASALLDQAGVTQSAEIFRRAFDVALLTGDEDRICHRMEAAPALSPTYPARIFCQARVGDWESAELTYGTAKALGFLDPVQEVLLGRFLDPVLFEDEELPPRSGPVTPLDFRLLEAIGEPPPTSTLPRAFAQLDLRQVAGWKAQIEAAERLARPGAIAPGQLLALYTERRPAASGGVWDRAAAIQALEKSLAGKKPEEIGPALVTAWQRMAVAELEPVLARMVYEQVRGLALEGEAGAVQFRLGLLTGDYAAAAAARSPADTNEQFLIAVATGKTPVPGRDPLMASVADGLASRRIPSRVATLIEGRRAGEALLRAIELIAAGAAGELDQLSDGLATLKALGFEDAARRSALELLVLDRRG